MISLAGMKIIAIVIKFHWNSKYTKSAFITKIPRKKILHFVIKNMSCKQCWQNFAYPRRFFFLYKTNVHLNPKNPIFNKFLLVQNLLNRFTFLFFASNFIFIEWQQFLFLHDLKLFSYLMAWIVNFCAFYSRRKWLK